MVRAGVLQQPQHAKHTQHARPSDAAVNTDTSGRPSGGNRDRLEARVGCTHAVQEPDSCRGPTWRQPVRGALGSRYPSAPPDTHVRSGGRPLPRSHTASHTAPSAPRISDLLQPPPWAARQHTQHLGASRLTPQQVYTSCHRVNSTTLTVRPIVPGRKPPVIQAMSRPPHSPQARRPTPTLGHWPLRAHRAHISAPPLPLSWAASPSPALPAVPGSYSRSCSGPAPTPALSHTHGAHAAASSRPHLHQPAPVCLKVLVCMGYSRIKRGCCL